MFKEPDCVENVVPVNINGLMLIRVVVDGVNAEIVEYSPITEEGNPDLMRQRVYTGKLNMQSNKGPITINFVIPGTTLSAAITNYPEAVVKAYQEFKSQMTRNSIMHGVGKGPSGGMLDLSKLKKGN